MPRWCDDLGLLEGMVDWKNFYTLRNEYQDKGGRFGEGMHAFFRYGRFIRTTEDHIGLGPESVDVVDMVCIVEGARTPLIIRKVERYDQNEYRLIGDAYIHGMMHGEALKSSRLQMGGNGPAMKSTEPGGLQRLCRPDILT
jgi:hypothetical protein